MRRPFPICCNFYYADFAPVDASFSLVHILNTSLRLLHFLVLSYNSPKSLSSHLAERPVGQDYFVTGIGRVACTEPPDWITDQAVVRTLAEASNVALDMLQDVLSPDEVEEVSQL